MNILQSLGLLIAIVSMVGCERPDWHKERLEEEQANLSYWKTAVENYDWQFDKGDIVQHKSDNCSGVVLYRNLTQKAWHRNCSRLPVAQYVVRFRPKGSAQRTKGMLLGSGDSKPMAYVKQWFFEFELVRADK